MGKVWCGEGVRCPPRARAGEHRELPIGESGGKPPSHPTSTRPWVARIVTRVGGVDCLEIVAGLRIVTGLKMVARGRDRGKAQCQGIIDGVSGTLQPPDPERVTTVCEVWLSQNGERMLSKNSVTFSYVRRVSRAQLSIVVLGPSGTRDESVEGALSTPERVLPVAVEGAPDPIVVVPVSAAVVPAGTSGAVAVVEATAGALPPSCVVKMIVLGTGAVSM